MTQPPAAATSDAAGASGSGASDTEAAAPTGGTSAPDIDADVDVAQSPPSAPTPTFAWTESIPGAGACQPAMFTGRFYCQIQPLVGDPDQLTGSINLVLRGSSEMQALNIDIDGGQISVYDENMNHIVIASVSGGLQCATQHFEAAIDPTPSNAISLEQAVAWAILNVQPTVSGTLQGSLDPDLQEISGEITLLFDTNARCEGEFQVKAWAFE